MCCNVFRKKQIFSKPLDTKLVVPQNSQHSTAQHSTSYNSARNSFSGYPHFKSNSQHTYIIFINTRHYHVFLHGDAFFCF